MEESKQSAKTEFFKLSAKHSELQSTIDNYLYNIRKTQAEYNKTGNHAMYNPIIRDLTATMRKLKEDALLLKRAMKGLKQEVEESKHEDLRLQRAMEESKQAMEEPTQEDLQLQRAMEESKQSAKTELSKLSAKYSELIKTIAEYRYKAMNTQAEYNKTENHEKYKPIMKDLTTTMRKLKKEQQEILNRMRALNPDVYNHLGGSKQYSDDYSRRKYLKYKTKYLNLSKK
jgi:chromosome segregation ATPase